MVYPRVWANRITVSLALAVALPCIALTARLVPSSTRRVALICTRAAGRLTGVRFETVGKRSPTRKGMRVLVANHSSPLDIPAMLVADPAAIFVAGADLFKIPLLAAAMRAMGTVAVDRRSRNRTELHLPAGVASDDLSLVVFPEGGIAPSGQRRAFHRGAFALAIQHHALVVPVAIHHSAEALPPRSRLGVRPATVTIEFLHPIPTTALTHADRHRICEQAERRIGAALSAGAAGMAPDPISPVVRSA